MSARMVGRDTDGGFKDFAQEKYRELQAFVPGEDYSPEAPGYASAHPASMPFGPRSVMP